LYRINKNTMICFPNAKINIGLNIIHKRNDGFHNIESVFLPIQLCDILDFVEIQKDTKKNTYLEISGIQIDGENQDNLIMRAYRLLANEFNLPELEIHLHKKIPMQAGLGGGSADAAFLLNCLNRKYNLGLSLANLKRYASQIGADCSFFVENKAAFVSGKGEILESIDIDLSKNNIVIVKTNINVSTAEAYAGVIPNKPKYPLKELIKSPISEWKNKIHNDFEDGIFSSNSKLKEIKQKLYDLGAEYASMSGSGSAIYGIFDKEICIQKQFKDCFVWRGKVISNY